MLLKNVGLQLYSLRDEAKKDFCAVVEATAKMGYTGVEFAGYGGLSPKEMAKLLKDNGLAVYGTHFGSLPKTEQELNTEMEMNAAIGNRYLVCPGTKMENRDDALRFADTMNATAQTLRKAGMRLGYHNHAHEFAKDGDQYLLDILFENTEKDIFAEVDVFWAAYAGVDPLSYISKYPNRLDLIHLKEMGADHKSNVEIGTGILDFSAIIQAAKKLGTQHFIVEQEEYTMPTLQSCKVSLENLKKL